MNPWPAMVRENISLRANAARSRIVFGKVGKMSKITVYGLEQEEEWTGIVKSFTESDVYYLPGYVKAFRQNGDGCPILLYYEADTLRAINVVMKRPVPVPCGVGETDRDLEEYYDFVTPYGYGGFLLEGDRNPESVEDLRESYEEYCRAEKIVAEFVRFHPVLRNAHTVDALYQVVDLGNTVRMDTSSREIIWNNLTSKNRNMVRKAQKSGVKVYWGRDRVLFREFETIYNATMDKVKAGSYYYFNSDFYDSILEDLKYHAMIFYAKLEDEIIAMSIILFGNKQAHYHLSASKKEFQHLAPTNLILYEAANYASETGYTSLHLGGGLGSGKDSLYSFKKQFNRYEDYTFSIGRKIILQDIYDRLCDCNGPAGDTGFFPGYRA